MITEANKLELGDEVEYRVVVRRTKICAEFIKAVPKGTVSPEVRNNLLYFIILSEYEYEFTSIDIRMNARFI